MSEEWSETLRQLDKLCGPNRVGPHTFKLSARTELLIKREIRGTAPFILPDLRWLLTVGAWAVMDPDRRGDITMSPVCRSKQRWSETCHAVDLMWGSTCMETLVFERVARHVVRAVESKIAMGVREQTTDLIMFLEDDITAGKMEEMDKL